MTQKTLELRKDDGWGGRGRLWPWQTLVIRELVTQLILLDIISRVQMNPVTDC